MVTFLFTKFNYLCLLLKGIIMLFSILLQSQKKRKKKNY